MVLLPGCACCGGGGCPCPTDEPVPHRVTVALSGLSHGSTKIENLVGLVFSAPFGSGASGAVSVGGGKVGDPGFPIDSVSLTNGGSGYARLGRRAPTLTISGGGTGATFTPSLTSLNDALGMPAWSLSSVSCSGGSNYADGESLTISVSSGDTQIEAASAILRTSRAQPTLTATANGGTGAAFSVSLQQIEYEGRLAWEVADVSVTNGGTGYPLNGSLSVGFASGGTEAVPAYVTFSCGRIEPTVNASVYWSAGSGASLSVFLSQNTGWDGNAVWNVSSVTVENGGSGYSQWDYVIFSSPDGEGYGDGVVTSVDENGAITSVSPSYGQFYKSDGVIGSVSVDSRGVYYKDDGVASSVEVLNGGKYYREDASLQPYVATVTVTVTQSPPSNGSGATVSATVNTNTSSSGFGSISSIELTSAGSGYFGWAWDECLIPALNGRSFTLPRVRAMTATGSFAKTGDLLPLIFESSIGGSGASATVVAPGGDEDFDNGPITSVSLNAGGSGYARIGREQPSLSIQPAPQSLGSGATFTPTFSQRQDAYGLDYWVVNSVSVSGGSCYGVSNRQEPYLNAFATGGRGAYLVASLTRLVDDCGGSYWAVSNINLYVSNNWTPYTNGSQVTITALDGAVVRTAATATLQTDNIGMPTGVTITEPGAYFKKGPDESLQISPATVNDKQQRQAVFTLQTDDNGTPTGVTVTNGGEYYRENKSLQPYSPGVNVVLNQASPSKGTGAAFTATVDSDPYSSNFGKIASVSVTNAGSGYLSWAYPRTCLYSRCAIVRGTHLNAFYGREVESASAAQITVELKGPNSPPEVRISIASANPYAPCPCRTCGAAAVTLTADPDDAPFGCSGTLFTASEQFGGQAVVTADSSGEPCYEQVYAANSLNVTLSGTNAEFTVQGRCWQVTNDEPPNRVRVRVTGGKTNGADLAGTFSCELVEQLAGGARRFQYDIGEVCGLVLSSWLGSSATLGQQPMLIGIVLNPITYSLTGVQQGYAFVYVGGLATSWKGMESAGPHDTDHGEVSESCRTTNLTSGGAYAFPCFGDIKNIGGTIVEPIVFRFSSADGEPCSVTWASDPNISIEGIEIEE